jgi:hypothetical protein
LESLSSEWKPDNQKLFNSRRFYHEIKSQTPSISFNSCKKSNKVPPRKTHNTRPQVEIQPKEKEEREKQTDSAIDAKTHKAAKTNE